MVDNHVKNTASELVETHLLASLLKRTAGELVETQPGGATVSLASVCIDQGNAQVK